MNIVCIYRASCFSPNMEDCDAAIMNAVVSRVKQAGHMVSCVHEEQLTLSDMKAADVVLTMGRLPHTIDCLQALEGEGVKVINTPVSVRNSERKLFTQILMDEDVPFALSRLFPSNDPVSWNVFPCWLKKGEGYAEVAEDVVYVQNAEQLAAYADRMRQRGISIIVVSQHLEGDLIKFYGVRGTPFFEWYYASDGHSKFGNETVNGASHHYPFSEQQLCDICNHAASVIGLDVYGGDCVVKENGMIQLIDINDWPSFSRCREQAAEMITNIAIQNDK